MALRMNHNINFFLPDGTEIDCNANSIEIVSDVNKLTGTAVIKIPYVGNYIRSTANSEDKNNGILKVMPNKLLFKTVKRKTISLESRTTYVEIDMGFPNAREYSEENKSFVGIISEFKRVGDEVLIYCEDPMYLFKTAKFNFSFQTNTLFELIRYIFTLGNFVFDGTTSKYQNPFLGTQIKQKYIDYKNLKYGGLVEDENNLGVDTFTGSFELSLGIEGTYFIQDVQLPNITLKGYLTLAEVFEKLKDQYGIYTYFRNRAIQKTIKDENDKDVVIIASELVLHSGFKYFKATASVGLDGKAFYNFYRYRYPYDRPRKFIYFITDASGMTYNNFDKDNDLAVIITSNISGSNRRLATIDGITFFTNFQPDISDSRLEYIKIANSEAENLTEVQAQEKRDQIFDRRINSRISRIEANIPNLTASNMLQLAFSKWEDQPSASLIGNFTALLMSPIERSDKVDVHFEDLYIRYYVEKVVKKYSPSTGITQTIYVKNKLREVSDEKLAELNLQ